MSGRDYLGLALAYEQGVRSGGIPACKWVRLACDRNAADLERQRSGEFPYWFDQAAAVAICQAAEQFPHIKGPKAKVIGQDDEGRAVWNPIQLEAWQCWILTTIFGWKRAGTALRRFRTAFVLVPRKNAKSTIAAVVLLFMLTADGEVGAECYPAATTRDQAKVVAEIAWEMARKSPQFCEYFGVRVGAKTTRKLEVPETASRAEPLSADAHTLDGLNVHLGVIDELHAHRTRDVWDVIETATGARDQPLMLPITTAGVDTGGICYELLTYLHKVLDGVLQDESFFGVNYTIDEGDDWKTPATWQKANPNYGVSVRPDDLERKALKAQGSPASINNFLTKHLNVWVKADASWMPMQAWHACADKTLKVEDFADAPCWIGVDLAEVRDVAALVALFRPSPHKYVAFGRFYLPEDTIANSPVAQYSGWVHEKRLIPVAGQTIDYLQLEDDIVAWCDQLKNVQQIDFDRALGSHMLQSLQRRLQPRMGRDAVEKFIIVVPQSVEVMSPAMQELERKVLDGDLRHDGDPVLTWMASNVVVQRNFKDEIYPRKAGGKDSRNKIDGIVALVTALSQAMKSEPRKSSVYKRRGALVWNPATGFAPIGGDDAQPA
jgi:phage terminase large subunit-like protein